MATQSAPASSTPDPGRPRTEEPTPLRAAHTPNFPSLLRRLSASLLVTTYQAGKLAMGTTIQVWEFRDVPNVARRLEPAGTFDACYLPRSSHVTGNVLIHEMAYGAGGELWLVNTRFSCLAMLDAESSFVPRWRPPFVTELEPSDRCHLNGMAMVDGKPKFVTALGETNEMHGWRANKAKGGVVMDVDSGEIVCRGLSMPHSPRWHDGR